jgi:hypothetical protein
VWITYSAFSRYWRIHGSTNLWDTASTVYRIQENLGSGEKYCTVFSFNSVKATHQTKKMAAFWDVVPVV